MAGKRDLRTPIVDPRCRSVDSKGFLCKNQIKENGR